MKDLTSFWRHFPATDRRLYLSILIILGLSLTGLIYTWQFSADIVYAPSSALTLDLKPVGLTQFNFQFFTQVFTSQQFIVSERFIANHLTVSNFLMSGCAIGLLLGLALLLASASKFRPIPFYLSMALIAWWVIGCRLDSLGVIGVSAVIINGVVLIPIFIVSYLFNAIYVKVIFSIRVGLYSFLLLTYVAVILLLSNNTAIAVTFMAFAEPGTLATAVFFLLLIGFDVPAVLFIAATDTQKPTGRGTLYSFLGVVALYLLNVLLTYLHLTGAIKLDLIYISGFALMPVIVIAGIFSFRKKEELYLNWLCDFNVGGAFLYLGLALVTVAGITASFLSDNDAMTRVYEGTILLTQFCCGILFLIYITVNFEEYIGRNAHVNRVMYQPNHMSVLMLQVTSVVAIFILFVYNGRIEYFKTIAGYYNNIADSYLGQDQIRIARQYYLEAETYNFNNRHTNMGLATTSVMLGTPAFQKRYLDAALIRHSLPEVYLLLANYYRAADKPIEELLTYKAGVAKYPDNHQLINNLGLAFSGTIYQDSALHYLCIAYNISPSKTALTNLAALAAQNKRIALPDNIVKDLAKPDTTLKTLSINRIGFATTHGQVSNITINTKDTVAQAIEFAEVYNQAINNTINGATSETNLLNIWLSNGQNSHVLGRLIYATALQQYFSGNRLDGLKNMKFLARTPTPDQPEDQSFYALCAAQLAANSADTKLATQYLGPINNADTRVTAPQAGYAMQLNFLAGNAAGTQIQYQRLSTMAGQENPFAKTLIKQFDLPALQQYFAASAKNASGYTTATVLNAANNISDANIKAFYIASEAYRALNQDNTNICKELIVEALQIAPTYSTAFDYSSGVATLLKANINNYNPTAEDIKMVSENFKPFLLWLKKPSNPNANEWERIFKATPTSYFISRQAFKALNRKIATKKLAYDLVLQAYLLQPDNRLFQNLYLEACAENGYDTFVTGILAELSTTGYPETYIKQLEATYAEYQKVVLNGGIK